MGRFNKFFDAVNRVADPKIEAGDEAVNAENPRNWLSGKVNSILPDDYQIPLQTVADEKQQLIDLPQNIAGSAMGRLGEVPKVAPRFDKLINKVSNRDVMDHPEMVDFLANNKLADRVKFPSPSQYTNAKQALINKLRGI